MSLFKDMLDLDLDTFINPDEFGEEVEIDGEIITVVFNEDDLKEIQLSEGEGLHEDELLFHVKKDDFPFYPRPDQQLYFNDELYRVVDASEEDGLFTIRIRVVGA